MNINETLQLKLPTTTKHRNSLKYFKPFSPKEKKDKFKSKNIRFYKLPKTLSQKLNNNIIKESLILSLREELKYNEKINKTCTKYITEVISLKEKVKKNKEEVELNCEKLKAEFEEQFAVIDNFENQINLLNEEKKEIVRTNEEIINLKNEQNQLLKNQFNKVQEDANKQMEEIQILKNKINDLTVKKQNLNDELEKGLKIEEEKHKILLKEYQALSKKYDYYQIEYDKYDLFPDEIIKKGINLYDNTHSNDILTEENLKIKLSEKKFIRDELINSIQILQKKVNKLEEEQNEIKMREKKYGKNLDMTNIKLKKNKNKKIQMNNNDIHNNYISEKYQGNKRLKTVENKRNIF